MCDIHVFLTGSTCRGRNREGQLGNGERSQEPQVSGWKQVITFLFVPAPCMLDGNERRDVMRVLTRGAVKHSWRRIIPSAAPLTERHMCFTMLLMTFDAQNEPNRVEGLAHERIAKAAAGTGHSLVLSRKGELYTFGAHYERSVDTVRYPDSDCMRMPALCTHALTLNKMRV